MLGQRGARQRLERRGGPRDSAFAAGSPRGSTVYEDPIPISRFGSLATNMPMDHFFIVFELFPTSEANRSMLGNLVAV